MSTTSLGKKTGAIRPGGLAWVCVVAIGLGALSACATRHNRQGEAAPRAPKDPRFLAVPANLLPPAAPAPVAQAVPQREIPLRPAAKPPAAAVAPAPSVAKPPATTTAPLAKTEASPTNDALDTGKRLYRFKADQLELRLALAQFARANKLNIILDNDVVGTITVDLHDLPLDQVMRALLDAADCSWQEERGLIRVRNTETRTFTVDYLRLARTGHDPRSALPAADDGTGGTTGGTMAGNGSGSAGSSANLTTYNPVDFWKELRTEISSMLTEPGRQSLAMNMTAGLVELTDRPSVLRRVERYLKGVERSIHRQVDMDVRLYTVTLNEQSPFGIDWGRVAAAYGGRLGHGATPTVTGGQPRQHSVPSGSNGNLPDPSRGGNFSLLFFKNFNTDAALNALQAQGKVEVISQPRVRTFNNHTALVKIAQDKLLFHTGTAAQSSWAFEPLPTVNTAAKSVTIGTVLSLTPQISEDGWISLDISPVVTSLSATVPEPQVNSRTRRNAVSGTAVPDLETKQASSLVRVRDGTTVVLGGLIQSTVAQNQSKVPFLGDLPLLGPLFTDTYDSRHKQELVIFVTPHIVRDAEPTVNANVQARPLGVVTLK